MLVKNLLEALDRRFPLDAAAAWDPVGLQFGRGDRAVGRVGVCHEVTEAVVATAVADRVSTLVSYHPLLFDQPGPLVGGPTPEGRALSLIENRIALIVVHTAMDAASPGTGDHAMASLGIAVKASLDDEDGTPIGRVGVLDGGIDAEALAARVGSALDTTVRIADAGGEIRSLAVVPGSGGSFVDFAVGTVDCLITGDVSHHRARSAVDRGLSVLDVGHTAAERPAIGALYAAVLDVSEDVVFIEADPSPWKD